MATSHSSAFLLTTDLFAHRPLQRAVPFLTLEDPRAKIKGSRDPLGVTPIWSHIGRKLVCNLTVAANSVRGFSIALLGRYFGERLIANGVLPESEALPLFLRMEQIGAFVRHVGSGVSDDIRGIDRVASRARENPRSATIANDRSGWILSNQKVYGLWGLFSVSSRASGLFTEGTVGVTPEARTFVEKTYLPILEPQLDALQRLLVHGGELRLGPRDRLFSALLETIPDPIRSDEATFYGETIRDALPTPHILSHVTPGRQQHLRRLLEQHTDLAAGVSRAEFATLARAARQQDEGLAIALDQAQVLEGLLVLVGPLFDHILASHGQNAAEIARSMRDSWGRQLPNLDASAVRELFPDLEVSAGAEQASVILRTADALASADYEATVHELLHWNELVMRQRGAAAWVRLDSGKLNVSYRGAETRLPSGDALPELWNNGYFVTSLKNISKQIVQAR